MIFELKQALRSLARAPGFVAVVVLILGLGIGANTAIFSVVRAVLLRPLPFREPGRLVRIFESFREGGDEAQLALAPLTWQRWRASNTVFEDIGAATGTRTLGVMSRNRPAMFFPYPTSAGHRAYYSHAECSPCHRDVCGDLRCLRALHPDGAWRLLETMLGPQAAAAGS